MSQPVHAPAGAPALAGTNAGEPANYDALRRTAEDFEAVFLAQMLHGMTSGLQGEGLFFGGKEGGPFHSILNQEVAKLISKSGGIGVADGILQEMLKLQEVA